MTKKIKLKISARLMKKRTHKKTSSGGVKRCRFCGSDEQLQSLDYKNAIFLRNFITERGKILPSRISGCCSRHQRELSTQIKKSRIAALLPYTSKFI